MEITITTTGVDGTSATLQRLGEAAAEMNGAAYAVGSEVAYAGFQELGTSRMPAHPYLTPALEIETDSITAGVGAAFAAVADGAPSTDVKAALRAGADRVVVTAQGLVAVLTGTLRTSIAVSEYDHGIDSVAYVDAGGLRLSAGDLRTGGGPAAGKGRKGKRPKLPGGQTDGGPERRPW